MHMDQTKRNVMCCFCTRKTYKLLNPPLLNPLLIPPNVLWGIYSMNTIIAACWNAFVAVFSGSLFSLPQSRTNVSWICFALLFVKFVLLACVFEPDATHFHANKSCTHQEPSVFSRLNIWTFENWEPILKIELLSLFQMDFLKSGRMQARHL